MNHLSSPRNMDEKMNRGRGKAPFPQLPNVVLQEEMLQAPTSTALHSVVPCQVALEGQVTGRCPVLLKSH